jgi:hypothetical protein
MQLSPHHIQRKAELGSSVEAGKCLYLNSRYVEEAQHILHKNLLSLLLFEVYIWHEGLHSETA